MSKNENLVEMPLEQGSNCKVHGRTNGSLSPLTLFWTGSGLELNARCSELWIEVEVDYDSYEPWISVAINGAPVSRQMLLKGRYWIPVFRSMDASVVKNVMIVKDVQAMSGDPLHMLQIHQVKCDGELLPVEEKKIKLEFIGDSITSGEGTVGALEELDWISMWFSVFRNYAHLTSKKMDAEYRILSQSGWGVTCSWDNNPNCNLPKGYEKVCGVLSGEKNEALGALSQNDFSTWQPDAIVINLGTNDNGAFHNSGWTDPETGECFELGMIDEQNYVEEDLHVFENAVVSFLGKLRSYNKHAKLVWAYGMLGNELLPYIGTAIARYRKESKDSNVYLCTLPNTNEKTVGARSHPGELAHKKAAEELSLFLKEIIK